MRTVAALREVNRYSTVHDFLVERMAAGAAIADLRVMHRSRVKL